MINLIVAFDDNDDELGEYFERSYESLKDFFSDIPNVSVLSLNGLASTEQNVIDLILSFKEDRFSFAGLSHGNDSQLLTNNEVYVGANNLGHFKRSLFYSPACSTAIDLGVKLVDNGCFTYVGCNQETFVTYDDFSEVYMDCENHCLKEFLSSDVTIKKAFQNMLSYFDEKIMKLLEQHDDEILVAMELIGNRDSFVLYGNTQLIKSDLD